MHYYCLNVTSIDPSIVIHNDDNLSYQAIQKGRVPKYFLVYNAKCYIASTIEEDLLLLDFSIWLKVML